MKTLYQHLESIGIVQKDEISYRLMRLSERELSRFFESYLEIITKKPLAIQATNDATDIYPDSWADLMSLNLISQIAIYANRIYIHDPLLRFALDWPHLDFNPNYVMHSNTHEQRVAEFRANLISNIEFLYELRPLGEIGVIQLTPVELIQPRREPGISYTDDFYGPSGSIKIAHQKDKLRLPRSVVEYCKGHLKVYPAKFINGEPTKIADTLSTPHNMIIVMFEGDPFFHYYQYFQIISTDEENREVVMVHNRDGRQEIDRSTFRHWVKGSKEKVRAERIQRLRNDLLISAKAGAKFITNLPVSRDMIQLDLRVGVKNMKDNVTTALLNMDLPFFEKASLSSIAKARQNEIAFEEFKNALDKAFKEIDLLPASPEFQKRADEVTRDLISLPVARIEQQMEVLQRNLIIDSMIAIGSLGATIFTQGNTLLTTALILAAGKAGDMYKQGKAEEDKIRQLPSFFYWDATRRR